LDISDVIGYRDGGTTRRGVETAHHGRISVREEHPAEAFEAYGGEGVTSLICEEKHMGSRAVVLVCRDEATAAARFGPSDGTTGAVHTRTGRSFFPPELTEQLLDRVRCAATAAGLWVDLHTDWLLLDAELLPWSAKAEDLLRHQYAAVGASARAALPAAVAALESARAAGIDVEQLLGRIRSRAANAEAFTAAYRRYCWPPRERHTTTGTTGGTSRLPTGSRTPRRSSSGGRSGAQ